jgi:hypothetical protein
MQGEIRVTVIATGFDRAMGQVPSVGAHATMSTTPQSVRNVIPINATQRQQVRVTPQNPPRPIAAQPSGEPVRRVVPPSAPAPKADSELTDMDIPTFIRRQMD